MEKCKQLNFAASLERLATTLEKLNTPQQLNVIPRFPTRKALGVPPFAVFKWSGLRFPM
jgi:hypothetical protein